MSVKNKIVPEWLQNSKNLPSKSNNLNSVEKTDKTKTKKNQNKNKNVKENTSEEHIDFFQGLIGVFIHIWETKIKFENQDGLLILISPYEPFSSYLESLTIPPSLVPSLNKANCNFICGYLAAKIFDYRHLDSNELESLPSQAICKDVLLKPTQETIQADLSYLANEQNIMITQEDAFQLESEVLIAHNPVLDLRVDDASQSINIAINNIKSINDTPTPKCLKNSSEIESEVAGRKKLQALMRLREENQPRRDGDSLISLADGLRKKRMAVDEIPYQGLDAKKAKTRRISSDFSQGLKLLRTLRFETQADKNKSFVILNLFEGPGGRRKCILRQGSSPNSTTDSFSKEINFISISQTEEYIDNFIKSYSDLFDLTFDSNTAQMLTHTESNPSQALATVPVSSINHDQAQTPRSSLKSAPIPSAPPSINSPSLSQNVLSNLGAPALPLGINQSQDGNIVPGASMPIQLTAQQMADYQMARKKQLAQQSFQLQQDFAKGELTPAQLQQLQYMNASVGRPGQDPNLRPQFLGYNTAALQAQHLQKLQQMQNAGGFSGANVNMSQPGQEALAQQQLFNAAKTKQVYEALLKQRMNAQQEPNHNVIRPNQSMGTNLARPNNPTSAFTPQQRIALAALQNKQILSDQQKQAIDELLSLPNLNDKFRQVVTSLRSQSNVLNQAQSSTENKAVSTPQLSSKAPDPSSEISTPNPSVSAMSQQPHATPLQSSTPLSSQRQFASHTGTPRIQPVLSSQNTPKISQEPSTQQSNINAPQGQVTLTPQQQQAFNVIQQQALDPNQANALQMLQQIPTPTPQQQAMLNALQAKQAQYLYLKKNFLIQHQQMLQAKQQSAIQAHAQSLNSNNLQQKGFENQGQNAIQNNQQQGAQQQMNAQQLHNLKQQQLNSHLQPQLNAQQQQFNMQQQLNAQLQSQLNSQQQSFNNQQQSHLQTTNASTNSLEEAAQVANNTQVTNNPASLLSPHEQQTIRMNTLQQQQAVHLNANRGQYLAAYQQQLMLGQTPGMRPRPMMRPTLQQQQQIFARLQQQAMMNPANQLAARNHLMSMNLAQAQGMRPLHPGVHANMMAQLSRPNMEGMNTGLPQAGSHLTGDVNTPGTPQIRPFSNHQPRPM